MNIRKSAVSAALVLAAAALAITAGEAAASTGDSHDAGISLSQRGDHQGAGGNGGGGEGGSSRP